jgi:hypothetical protein
LSRNSLSREVITRIARYEFGSIFLNSSMSRNTSEFSPTISRTTISG